MGYPTYEQWYGNLPDEVRARTDALIAELKSNGAADPEVWARSEISENIPQLARYLVLKRLWECEINPWFDDPETWIEEWSKDRHKTPIPVFADAAEAIRRVRNAGISSKDLGAIARLIAY